MGSREKASALQAYHDGGGATFPFRHGYAALGAVLDAMPPETWRRDEAVLGGLVLYLVKRGQAARAKSYLYAVNLDFEKTYLFDLMELLLSLHMGEPVSGAKLATWRRLERILPLSEPLLLGLYYNAMLAMLVRLGQVEDARVVGQQAISCYREDGHVYLEHFIHIHLAGLDVIEGRLNSAERRLSVSRRCLAQAGVSYGNECDVIEVIQMAIHYERGDLERVRREATRLRASLLTGDSWSELFFELARISVLSTYFLEGRKAAQAELEDFQADYARRHGGAATTVDVLNAWIWHLEWRPNEAERALDQIRRADIQSAIGNVLLGELARLLDISKPGQPPTPRGAIVACLQNAANQRGQARRSAIEKAIRLAIDERHVAPFLEHRDVFLGVSSKLANSGFARRNRRYAYLVSRIVRQVDESYVVPESLSAIGFNRRQYRVASALQGGATNKQVARQLGTSEATVKYHLTSLFRLTGLRGRAELIEFIDEVMGSPVS